MDIAEMFTFWTTISTH